MINLFKAVVIGLCIMALLSCVAPHWINFDRFIGGDHVLESFIELGAVLMTFIIAMVVVGLVIAGIFGSVLLAGLVVALVVIGTVFTGLVFSWPVVITVFVLWLLVREKPSRPRYR